MPKYLTPEEDFLRAAKQAADNRNWTPAIAVKNLYLPDGNSTMTREEYYAIRYGEAPPEVEAAA